MREYLFPKSIFKKIDGERFTLYETFTNKVEAEKGADYLRKTRFDFVRVINGGGKYNVYVKCGNRKRKVKGDKK